MRRILLVEPDSQSRESLSLALTTVGYVVQSVADGQTALELLEIEAALFDLVITEDVLPDLAGLAVIVAARAHNPRPEVIILTKVGTLHSAIQALRAGVFDYLLKPCDLPELLGTIRGAMASRSDKLRAPAPQLTAPVASPAHSAADLDFVTDPAGAP